MAFLQDAGRRADIGGLQPAAFTIDEAEDVLEPLAGADRGVGPVVVHVEAAIFGRGVHHDVGRSAFAEVDLG